jgi:hypothetical protein
MKLALDTDRYTDLCRGEAPVAAAVERADEVWLPLRGRMRFGCRLSWSANCALDLRWEVKGCATKLCCASSFSSRVWGFCMLMSRPRTIMQAFTGNCAGKGCRFLQTICGSRRSSCSIPLYFARAMRTSMRWRRSRGFRVRAALHGRIRLLLNRTTLDGYRGLKSLRGSKDRCLHYLPRHRTVQPNPHLPEPVSRTTHYKSFCRSRSCQRL